ncbi:MAG: hypothetical protein H6733_11945 [Alphaproteobacteria bacterium]|nr:hypothetical protein [Alphaproteobacteria bacterium]
MSRRTLSLVPWLPVALALVGCAGDADKADPDTDTVDTDTLDTDVETNQPPTVTLSGPSIALVGRSVQVVATADDPEDDALTYAWTQTAGPSAGLSGDDTSGPWILPRKVGTYTLSVVVSDGTHTLDAQTVSFDVHDIDGGERFTVALKPDGTLWSWGTDWAGQLGNGAGGSDPVLAPARVCAVGATMDCDTEPLEGAVAISVGAQHVLALRDDGTVVAWGDNNAGQLGIGTVGGASSLPVPVCDVGATDCAADPLDDVLAIAAGYLFSAALKRDGTVVTWGYNSDGQLGNGGTSGPVGTAAPVCAFGDTPPCTLFLGGVRQIVAGGGGHALAMTLDGDILSWGHNKAGQLGVGDVATRQYAVPQKVCAVGGVTPCATFLTGVRTLDAWSGSSMALMEDGSVLAWGGNDQFEAGSTTVDTCLNGEPCAPSPAPVCRSGDDPCTTPMTNIVNVALGRAFGVAVRRSGAVEVWGENELHQLGLGHIDPGMVPQMVCDVGDTDQPCETLGDVAAVATGNYHTVALKRDGSMVAWGLAQDGALGSGDTDQPTVPVDVPTY